MDRQHLAFAAGLRRILVWVVTGPFFGYSDTWQLVINTGTTIVTFLMVFLIQRSQNKDSLAVHLKLNELVAAMDGASNRLIDVEDLTEDELKTLHRHYASSCRWRARTQPHEVALGSRGAGRHAANGVYQQQRVRSKVDWPATRRAAMPRLPSTRGRHRRP